MEITRWILVDHNQFPGDLGSIYASRVHGVIDHHAEEDAVHQDTDPEPRVLENSGSCTSLVIRYFRSTWDSISDSSLSSGAGHAQSSDSTIDDRAVTQGWDAQVAKLALASILVDTVNLTSESKTEAVDREIVTYLEAKIQMSPKDARTWNRDQFYDEISTAKTDVNSLSLQDLLRKDYKQWTENGMELGMSTVVKPLAFLAAKAATENPKGKRDSALDEALEEYMATRQLSVLSIMTATTSLEGEFRRELLLQTNSHATDAANRFVGIATGELGLERINVDYIVQGTVQSKRYGHMWRRVWLQTETGKSRKQVGPLIRKAMR